MNESAEEIEREYEAHFKEAYYEIDTKPILDHSNILGWAYSWLHSSGLKVGRALTTMVVANNTETGEERIFRMDKDGHEGIGSYSKIRMAIELERPIAGWKIRKANP